MMSCRHEKLAEFQTYTVRTRLYNTSEVDLSIISFAIREGQ